MDLREGETKSLSTPAVIEMECMPLSSYHTWKIDCEICKAKKFYDECKYKDSLPLLENAYEILKIKAPEHTFTLYIAQFTGLVLYKLKNYEMALKYYELLEKQTKIGPYIPALLNNRGVTLYALGRCEEAYEMCQKAYIAWKRMFGFDHEVTLLGQHNTAYMLQRRHKYNEALEMYAEVHKIKVQKLGVDDPSTLMTQYYMAKAFKEHSKLQEAFTNFRYVFEKRKSTLGLRNPEVLDIWKELASVLAKLQKCDEEIEIYEHLHKGSAAAFGVDVEDALLMLEKIGDMFNEQHEYDEAFRRYNKLYELKKEADTDPKVLEVQNKMGLLLQIQGKDKEALEIFEDLYKNKVCIFPKSHSESLSVQRSIGEVLVELGELNKAFDTFADICIKRAGIFGINMGYILSDLKNKASVLVLQREYEKALKIYDSVYAISKGRSQHKDTVLVVKDMVDVFILQGNLNSAIEILYEVLEIENKNQHPNRLLTSGVIANIFREHRLFEDAFRTYKSIQSKQTQNLKPDHPDTLDTCADIASVQISLGKLDDALQTQEKALAVTKKKFGPEHKRTLTIELNAASVLRKLGRYEEALNIYKKIKLISKKPFFMLSVRKNIAEMLAARGQYEEAANILTDVLDVHIPDDPKILDTLLAITDIFLSLGKYNACLEILNKMYSISENSYGYKNRKTLIIRDNLARVLLRKQKYEEAFKIFREIYSVMKEPAVFGPDDFKTLCCYDSMAVILYWQKKHEEALGMMTEVYEKYKKSLPPKHSRLLSTEYVITSTLDKLGKYDKALSMHKALYAKYVKIFGATHPKTLMTKNRINRIEYFNSKYNLFLD